MPTSTFTGSANLPDIGTLSYNGVTWSCLYESRINGKAITTADNRTIKNMEYTLTVDGVVTLDDTKNDTTIDREFNILRQQLMVEGATLFYSGKGFGFPFAVNPGSNFVAIGAVSRFRDIAWGPIPKILDFIPLGASRSAQIKWQVVFNICEQLPPLRSTGPITQFNFDSEVDYDADGFSRIKLSGVLEIALTRPNVNQRVSTTTIDDFRVRLLDQIAVGFPLDTFKVTSRSFKTSRDKRTCDWSFVLDELPYMEPPIGILTANGTYSVDPIENKHLIGSVRWIASLQCTYIVPNGIPRRAAHIAFLTMWAVRMKQSQQGNILPNQQGPPLLPPDVQHGIAAGVAQIIGGIAAFSQQIAGQALSPQQGQIQPQQQQQKAIPIHFSFSEGLYLDSKTVTFRAKWQLITSIDRLLVASGLWMKTGLEGSLAWARSIQGGRSWLSNTLNAPSDVIVDFGGGANQLGT